MRSASAFFRPSRRPFGSKAVWIKGRLDQRPSWDRPQPKAGPGWHPEYEALCVWAWVGSFVPFMPDPHTKFLMLPGLNRSNRPTHTHEIPDTAPPSRVGG